MSVRTLTSSAQSQPCLLHILNLSIHLWTCIHHHGRKPFLPFCLYVLACISTLGVTSWLNAVLYGNNFQHHSNMAGILGSSSSRGQLYYLPWIEPPARPSGYFRPRRDRPAFIHITRLAERPNLKSRARCTLRRYLPNAKLATSRDNAKRFLRFVSASQSTSDTVRPAKAIKSRDSIAPRHIDLPEPTPAEEMVFANGERNRSQSVVAGPVSGMIHRPSLADTVRTASGASTTSSESTSNATGSIGDEKPIASGNGVSISIALAEPVLFLQGFDQADAGARTTSMLRGSLHLHVSKSAKIKAVTLAFRGRSETEWPEGEWLGRTIGLTCCEILIGYVLRRYPA